MTGENQFALYQMKQMPETRQIRFRSYKTLQERGIRIRQEDYEQVYRGAFYPQDTPEGVRERLDRQPPRSFSGHSVSVSDVLVFNRAGTVTSYYVEKAGFTVIENFIRKESSSSGFIVSIDTTGFQIEGKAGNWLAFDSIRLEGQEFFLMEHETYGKEAAWVVVDGAGRLAVDNVRNGFDRKVREKLEEYLHPSQPESDMQETAGRQPDMAVQENENPHLSQERKREEKHQPENRQTYTEDGEHLQCAEIRREQNYDRVDGRKSNGYKTLPSINSTPKKKKPQGRQSVLAKLHKKQAEIAKRGGKKERQMVAENGMEREEK